MAYLHPSKAQLTSYKPPSWKGCATEDLSPTWGTELGDAPSVHMSLAVSAEPFGIQNSLKAAGNFIHIILKSKVHQMLPKNEQSGFAHLPSSRNQPPRFANNPTVHFNIQSNMHKIIKFPIYPLGCLSSSTEACNDLQTGHTECRKATNRVVLASVSSWR